MQSNKNISIPQSGMIRDKHPSTLSESEYSFALNANIEGEDGSVMLRQNEPSNIKCMEFDGYKVIGYKNDVATNNTYFFLAHPTNKTSKIVFFESNEFANSIEDIEIGEGVDIERLLGEKLEESSDRYFPACGAYKILVEDDETDPCLNFSIAHPIKTIEIKAEKCGNVIYWTDGLNPPRYLDVIKALEPDLDGDLWYTYHGYKICDKDYDRDDFMSRNACKIACEKLRIFPLLDTPCILPEVIEYGGSLRAGVYQFCIALCDQFGNEMTNYHSLTNPIHVFDKNDILLKDGVWGGRTSCGIRLSVNFLDRQISHFKIGVIQNTVGYNGEAQPSHSFKIEGIHPITEQTIYYYTDLEAQDTTLIHLASQRPVYRTSRGITVSSNCLLQYGLEQEPEWNLQPVCNLLGHFMQWQTSFASEKLYEDGMACSKYAGYMRDEVYPFSICFTTSTGYKTAKFPLIPRPMRIDEGAEVDDQNLEKRSISQYVSICQGDGRTKRWQLENTAINLSRIGRDAEECKNMVEYYRTILVTKDIFVYKKNGEKIYLVFPTSISIPESEVPTYVENNLTKICDDPQTEDAEKICEMIAAEDDIEAPELADGCTDVVRDRSKDITYIKRGGVTDPVYGYEYTPVQDMNRLEGYNFPLPGNTMEDNVTMATLFPNGQEMYMPVVPNHIVTTRITDYDNIQDLIQGAILDKYCSKYDGEWDYTPYNILMGFAQSRYLGTSVVCSTGCSPAGAIENPEHTQGNPFTVQVARHTGPVLWLEGDEGMPNDNTDKILRQKSNDFLSNKHNLGNWQYNFKYTNPLTVYSGDKRFNTGLGQAEEFFETAHYGSYKLDYGRIMANKYGTFYSQGASVAVAYKFNKYVSQGAKWIKFTAPKEGDTIVIEMVTNGTAPVEAQVQDSTICRYARITFFCDTEGTPWPENPIASNSLVVDKNDYSSIVSYQGFYFRKEFSKSDFHGYDAMYIAIDTAMCILGNIYAPRSCRDKDKNTRYGAFAVYMTGMLPSYFGVGIRPKEVSGIKLEASSITVTRDANFTMTCVSCGDRPIECDPREYEFGEFGYWESVEKYPSNFELYDSSRVRISPKDMTEEKKAFMDGLIQYYGSAKNDGNGYYFDKGNNPDYPNASVLFCQQPIRHYKFPDNIVTPFMSDNAIPGSDDVYIYPLGIRLEEKYINGALDIAVDTGLITKEQRSLVNGFEIYRGDRRLNKSVIGTGLAFDMYKYQDDFGKDTFFPNFPYNELDQNKYIYTDQNRTSYIPHPFGSEKNNKFSFCSPDYLFNKPDLPTEIRIEGFQMGVSEGMFNDVEEYSRYVLLGSTAKAYASRMATLEAMAETWSLIATKALESCGPGGGGLIGGIVNLFKSIAEAAIAITQIALGYIERYTRYKNEWLKILEDRGIPERLAVYYSSIGRYNVFYANTDSSQDLRGIRMVKHMPPGRISFTPLGSGENLIINNVDRESSIFLDLGEDDFCLNYPNIYKTYDNSRLIEGETVLPDVLSGPLRKRGVVFSNVASPYFKAKRYNPSQYGGIENINWLSVGHCGKFGEYENGIIDLFGGDIFISRFAMKRKFRFFHTDAFGLADMLPFAHNDYRNVAFPKYFLDFKSVYNEETIRSIHVGGTYSDETPVQTETGAFVDSAYELHGTTNQWYIDGKFYTYMYGIPYFLVESDINYNERLKGVEPHEQFYPATTDYMEWTAQKNVSISIDNSYIISPIFQSKNVLGFKTLPETYERKFWDCAAQKPNGVIWSRKDISENSMSDPWLFYKPLDYFEFPSKHGKLVHLKGVESDIVMGRFENQVSLYNTIDVLKERVDPAIANEVGTGGMFASRSMDYNQTELGYSGSQSTEMVSTEYGHFWVDAKRGQVFMVNPNGEGLQALHPGMSHWLQEHLPFKILRYGIINIEDPSAPRPMNYEDVDNKFAGLGLSLGWDNRFKRVFVTKKDYVPIRDASGYKYKKSKFYYNGTEISLTDPTYFIDVSFTLAYSCKNNEWISYYSFTPDYYIEHLSYFQTGKNWSSDYREEGLWSHLLTAQSYQVFYGKKYPFMIELPVREQYVNKILSNIQYRMESRRYHSEIDFAIRRSAGFNKAWVYNHRDNSGLLNLIPEEKNNWAQKLRYPRAENGGMSIIATEESEGWSFNDFFNRVKNNENNIPQWIKDVNDIEKEVNGDAIYYNSVWKDRLRGDWFLIRYCNDDETRFKMIFRWQSNDEKIYRV